MSLCSLLCRQSLSSTYLLEALYLNSDLVWASRLGAFRVVFSHFGFGRKVSSNFGLDHNDFQVLVCNLGFLGQSQDKRECHISADVCLLFHSFEPYLGIP